MKAQELRAGNYILADVGLGWDREHRVQPLDIHSIHEKEVKTKPIPLTEDWLERLGFYKEILKPNEASQFSICIDTKKEIRPQDFLRIVNYNKPNSPIFMFRISCPNKWASLDFDYKYVHQVQNLYNSLTGKELSL